MATFRSPTTAGKRVSELIIKNRLSPEEATRQVLGDISNQFSLPQGATVLSSSLNDLIFKDAQGYTHRVQRQGDANAPDFGQVRELQTDRPEVLPLTEQIPGLSGALQGAISAVNQSLSGTGLRPLSPENQAMLDVISQNERNLIGQEATRAQGELVTGLYGSGTNRSTLANEAGANFAQALGIALGNQASNAATRGLDLQKFLTQLQTGTGLDFLGQITGQETQRATEGARVGLGKEQVEQQGEQAARNFMLEWEKYQATQRKSPLPGILSAVASLALAPVTGGTSLLGLGLGGLKNIGKKSPTPTLPD